MRPARADLEPPDELFDDSSVPLDFDPDGAIRRVLDVTLQIQRTRRVDYKEPVADTLHDAIYIDDGSNLTQLRSPPKPPRRRYAQWGSPSTDDAPL